jgi:hypothetical protein
MNIKFNKMQVRDWMVEKINDSVGNQFYDDEIDGKVIFGWIEEFSEKEFKKYIYDCYGKKFSIPICDHMIRVIVKLGKNIYIYT